MNPFFIADTTPAPYNDYGVPPFVPFEVKDVTIGPVDIQDTSEGLTNRFWAAYFDPTPKDLVLLDIDNNITEIILNEPDEIVNVALAFDQNANDNFAWITGTGELKIRWFDASLPGDSILSIGQAQSVTFTMDTNYYPSSIDSDILLFYIRDGAIYFRIQREKYDIEHVTPVTSGASTLFDSGTREDYRFQVRWR